MKDQSELLNETRRLLEKARYKESLEQISKNTGLSMGWINKIRNPPINKTSGLPMIPTVVKLEKLYKYLAKVDSLSLPSR